MTVFLAILKIIGLILLILLSAVILLIVLLLFVPVSYRIKGSIRDKKPSGRIRLSWLFGLLSFHIAGESDGILSTYIRVFGIRICLPRENKRQTEKSDEVESRADDTDRETSAGQSDSGKSEVFEISRKEDRTDETAAEGEGPDKEAGPATDKIKGLKQMAQNAEQTISRLKTCIEDEANRQAAAHIKEEIVRFFLCLMPRKLYLDAAYSAGSPDITAQLFGILAMFPVGYRNRWRIDPDFEAEEWYVDGEADVAGNLFLFHLIAIVVRLIMDKNCRRLIKQWKN